MTSSPPHPPGHDQASSPEASSRRKTPLLLKGMLWLASVLIVLLLCAGLLLTYWFPSELVRQELEVRLSDLLKGQVRIESLAFNLLTGLNIRHAQYRREGHPPLKVDKLHLDYSLWGLLQGRFRINEIALEGADLVLNLPELSQTAPPPEPQPAPPEDRPLIPVLPLSVDLETFKILDSHVQVIVSPDLLVGLNGLNLTSSGGISSEMARLDGTLDIKGIDLSFQDNNLQFPLTLVFDTSVDVATEQVKISRLTIQSEPILRLSLDGTITNLSTQMDLDVSLHDTQFDLAQLLRLGQAFVPPKFQNLLVKGRLSPQFTIKGAAPKGVFSGTIKGTLDGKGLEASLPAFSVQVSPTDVEFKARDLRVQRNVPILGQIDLKLLSRQLTYQTHQVRNLRFGLSGEYLDAGPVFGTLDISGETDLTQEWLGTLHVPFEINMAGRGNYKTQNLVLQDLNVHLGQYGQVRGQAVWDPQPASRKGTKTSLEFRWRPRLDTWLPLLPKEMLPGMTLKKGADPDLIHVKAQALVNEDFMPETGSLTTAIKLASLRAKLQDPSARATVKDLAFLLSTDYERAKGTFKGTAGLSTNLSQVSVPDQVSVQQGTVTLKSNFQGRLSPSFQPVELRSHDQLQVALDEVAVSHPSLSATLPTVKLLSNSKEDLMRKEILLDGLQLTSPGIFEIALQGRMIQPTQKFEVDLKVPVLLLDQLLPRLAGPATESLKRINPKGLLSVGIRTAGTIPSAEDIENMKLPLGFDGTLSLKDAGGTVAGYGLEGTNGTLSLRYAQSAAPPIQFTTDLHVERLQFPEGLPLKGLSNTGLQLKLASPSMNELAVNPLRVTSNGLNVTVQGTLVGLQSFLASASPLGSSLINAFAELTTRADVDFGVIQQIIRPLGVQGRGQAGLKVHLRKKEQGSLETSVDITLKDVSLKQNQSEIEVATGTIPLRKTLSWASGPGKVIRKKRFQPSDVITQLKRLSGKGKTFTVKRLQAGPLTIENFSTQLQFDQQALKLQDMSMNLMGGGLGGHFVMAAERPLKLSAWLEAAHLDLNRLVPPDSRIPGDSEIAATIGLTVLLQEETGALDLSQSELQVHITHIGTEALDRLLTSFDPQGSNPTLANARSQLKLANPSKVTITVARGLLNLAIHFQSGLIPTLMVERVPLAKMKNVERMTAAIPNWDALSGLLNLLAADAYMVSPEGSLTFQ